MGNFISQSISSQLTEGLIDYIQKNGLKNFQSNTLAFGKWYATRTFGLEIHRNQAFRDLQQQLKPQIKQGIKDAGWSPAKMSMDHEQYVNAYFTHL